MSPHNPHIIHSENGRLSNARPGSTTSPGEVRQMVADALSADDPSLLLHFHGGLVNQAAGRAIATKLAPVYEATGRYPIFFVWEAGLIEAISNNLVDILHDKLFQQSVKKLTRWLLEQLPAATGLKGAGGAVDAPTLEAEYDRYFTGEGPLPTAIQPATTAGATLRSATAPLDEMQLALNIQFELEQDPRFLAEVQAIDATITPPNVAAPEPKATGVGSTVSPLSEIDPAKVKEVFEVTPQTKGVFTVVKMAIFLAKALHRVIARFRAGRDHGVYTTIVEEILAGLYVDKVGGVIWRQMKKDTLDSFGDPASCAGAALVQQIAQQQAQAGKQFKRIVLVGHSTGAVYIANFLDHAAKALPQTRFDIVLLAPAVSYGRLAKTLANHGDRIEHVRRFGMQDAVESKDVLVPIVYPRSLLYFVSGLMESSNDDDPQREVDLPLVGMQRFSANAHTFTPALFPDIAAVEAFLGGFDQNSVWSVTAADTASGLGSSSQKHGDFDDDPVTVASLRHILDHGY